MGKAKINNVDIINKLDKYILDQNCFNEDTTAVLKILTDRVNDLTIEVRKLKQENRLLKRNLRVKSVK